MRAQKTSSLNFTKIYRSCSNKYAISDDVKDTYVLVKVNTICNFLSCTKSFSRSIVIYTIKTPVNGRIWHIKILGNKLWHLVELSDIGLMTGGVVSSYKNINYTDTVQAKFDQITADKNLRSFRIITKLSSAFLHVDNRLKKNTTGLKLPSEQIARCFTIVNYGFTRNLW